MLSRRPAAMSFQLPGSSATPAGAKLNTTAAAPKRPKVEPGNDAGSTPVDGETATSAPSGKRPRLGSEQASSADGGGVELPAAKSKGFKAHSSGIVPQIE